MKPTGSRLHWQVLSAFHEAGGLNDHRCKSSPNR